MEKVSVCGVDLEYVEPRRNRAAHRIAISVEHGLEVAFLERARGDPAGVNRLFGRRNRAPRLVAAIEVRLGQRAVSVPRTRHARLASGVRELNGGDGTLASDEV